MSRLYEIVELANGDIALQREGDTKAQPLVTMRFSTELLRFLQSGKIDIAKTMIEAGLEHVAQMADDVDGVDVDVMDVDIEEMDAAAHEDFGSIDEAEQEEVNVPENMISHLVH